MDVPGVLAVYTAADFARAGYGHMACKLPLKPTPPTLAALINDKRPTPYG
jgi:hypothetical protein